jgi:hypothetical protein
MFSLTIRSKWITLHIGNNGEAFRGKHKTMLGILVKPFVDGPLNAHVVLEVCCLTTLSVVKVILRRKWIKE